jgi:hypothetical protein
MLSLLAASVLAALGPTLTVAGHRLVSLPWRLVVSHPVFNNLLPVRLSVYLELAAAVLVALYAAGSGSLVLRVVLPLLAVLAILPNPVNAPRSTQYQVQPFFTASGYHDCLDPGETILPLPIGQGEAMLWQAESGFRFNIAGGFTGLYVPRGFETPVAVRYVTGGNHLGPYQADAVRLFVEKKHVTTVVVAGNEAAFFSGALDRLAKPQSVGVVVYRFTTTPPACGP